ncbi:hypothetical protein [Ornithinimicrobium kibberense]|uniref:hypothetical protein n=1 Tax=Ornithinimicrobium kibberense TaxID=282060 RepID=UPI00360AC732
MPVETGAPDRHEEVAGADPGRLVADPGHLDAPGVVGSVGQLGVEGHDEVGELHGDTLASGVHRPVVPGRRDGRGWVGSRSGAGVHRRPYASGVPCASGACHNQTRADRRTTQGEDT